MAGLIVDLFAGSGGWSEGLRTLGLADVGIELDRWACATRAVAGHATIRADVAAYPFEVFVGEVEGLIASPPCQDFSAAGRRAGVAGRTGHLVVEVMRWACALRPVWIACEQVPPVLPIWQEYAWRLRQLGYSTWAGLLNAADYGVPQTRVRAFLLAHRGRAAAPPERTHCRGGSEAGLWGPGLLPWVSMAEALGWDGVDRPAKTICGDRGPRWAYPGNETTGWTLRGNQIPDAAAREYHRRAVTAPAQTITQGHLYRWEFVNGNQPNAARGGPHEPAPTIHFGHNLNEVSWVTSRPATTVQRDRIGRPGHKDRSSDGEPQFAVDSVRVTVEEAAILQGFRPDYPWQGTKTARFAQVGNAVPPPMAAAVVGALTGGRP